MKRPPNRFVVWEEYAELIGEDGKPIRLVVVSRTDKKVAEEDAAIMRDIVHRKSWVQDQEEQS